MKQVFLISIVCCFLSCNPIKNADRLAEKNKKTILYPEFNFSAEVAKKQLEKGDGLIKGVLYKSTNKLSVTGAKSFGRGIKVDLYPVTDYFMAWYQLREKKENKKTVVYLSDEAYAMRLETYTDDYGRFEFKEMKPGKYFLQAFMSTSKTYSRDVVVGTNSYGTEFYQKENYNVIDHHRVEKFVEISKSGDIIEVKLN